MKPFMKTFAVLVALSAAPVACTHTNEAIQGNGPYTLEVVNPMPHAMEVSFTIGGGTATALGSVPAGQTRRFTLDNLPNDEIEVIASDASDTHLVRDLVELEEGAVVRVVLEAD